MFTFQPGAPISSHTGFTELKNGEVWECATDACYVEEQPQKD